jgi:hypothetical protein
MKNRFLPLLSILLVGLNLLAQNHSLQTDAIVEFPLAEDSTIVRNYNDQYSIGFIRDNGNSYFYSTSIQPFMGTGSVPLTSGTKMPLPPGTVVNDMVQQDGLTFFCGHLNHVWGIYGWFSTNDLCTGTICSVECRYYTPPISLKKMVIVKTGLASGPNIVAIGEDFSSLGVNYIIEILGAMTTSPHLLYAPLPAYTSNIKQTLRGVHVIGDQAVFVGVDSRPTYKTFFVKKANAQHVVYDVQLATTYYYSPIDGSEIMTQFEPCSEVVNNDILSIAHMAVNNELGTQMAITNIDVLGTMNCINTHVLTRYNRTHLYDMRYEPACKSLVLLHGMGSPNPSNFFVYQPLMNTSYPTHIFSSTEQYRTLDVLGNAGFISAGTNQWFLQQIPSTYFCYPKTEVLVTLSEYRRTQEVQGISSSVIYPVYTMVPDTVSTISIDVNCLR